MVLFEGVVHEMRNQVLLTTLIHSKPPILNRPNQKKDDIGLLRTMAAGSVGGICLWTAIFPADVIKSRVQINNIEANMFTMGVQIARTEGVAALYNGLKPTILRTIPATAVLFAVYEYSKKFMSNAFL